jgi:hypothetical protein
VCTTVAIAIVAETCSPFTVLPGLMNEYRVRKPYCVNPDQHLARIRIHFPSGI